MSSLARSSSRTGKNVAGYDRTPAPLTRPLEEEGISIHYEDSVKLIPLSFQSPSDTLVILTPAVPRDHSEYLWFSNNGFSILKRSEILGQITSSYKTVAVAGTHGKTTISTMITFIMSRSKQGCSAFLGGIAKNFNSNLLMNPESKWMVTEADEFDRSFLQLHPYVGVVTAMDADHLDIYGNASAMQNAFNNYVSQIDRDGILLMKKDLPLKVDLVPKKTYTYSLQGKSDFYAENIRLENKRYTFDLTGPSIEIKNLSLEHPGLLNVENAVAASSVCALLGIEEDIIRRALAEFTGILRRFDYQIKTDELVFIDDYAHHPKEIEATLKSVRELYHDKKITGIFQPHLYSRTRDFAEDFAESLSLLDRLLL